MTYIPMSDQTERRTRDFHKWVANARRTKVYCDIRIWCSGGGYLSALYPAYALPWNRPPKPRRKPWPARKGKSNV